MASKVPSVFVNIAQRLGMDESDFQVLLASNIDTADELFFRLSDEAMLDSFITTTFYTNSAGWNADRNEAVMYERNSEVTPGEFKIGKSAANLRRLWMAARTLAKKDIEQMTADVQDDKPRKISAAVIQDAFAKAARRGIVVPNDRVRPGNVTMSKVLENFRIGGSFRHLEWEEFVSKQDEEQALIQGLKPKTGFKIVQGDSSALEGKADLQELRRVQVEEKSFVIFEDTMQLRSLAFDVGEICSKDKVDALYAVYMDAMRSVPPLSFRTPYMSEIRLLDKHIFQDILKNVLDGQGTIEDGITFFLSEPGRANKVWKLCEQMPADYPDRGATQSVSQVAIYDVNTEKYIKEQSATGKSDAPAGKKRARSRSPKRCWHCGGTRAEHKDRLFDECNAKAKGSGTAYPPKGRKKAKAAGSGAKGKGKDKGKAPASMPSSLVGCARRTPNSPQHPEGQRFCFDFHNPSATCTRAECKLSHRCPKFVEGDKICMKEHPIYEHGN